MIFASIVGFNFLSANIPTGDDVILPMKSDAMNTANEECDIDHCNTSEQPLAAYEVSCVPYFKWEVFEVHYLYHFSCIV